MERGRRRHGARRGHRGARRRAGLPVDRGTARGRPPFTSWRPSPGRTAGTPVCTATSSICTPPPAPSKPAGASPRCPRSTAPRADGRSPARPRKPPAAASRRPPGTPCSAPSARPPPSHTATPTFSTGSATPACACANAWATTAPSSGTRSRCPGTARPSTRPVWFAGPTLAYDLSLPRVRERFTPLVTPADWALAERRIREASTLLGRAGQDEGASDVAALGDLLSVAAAHAPALVRDRVQAAADAFEQAARAPGARSLEGRARAGWRASSRALERAPRAARGGGAAVVLTLLLLLLLALVEAVEAAASWHRAQAFRAQAKAASEAAVLLWEAAGLTGASPPTMKPRTGRVVRTPHRGLPGVAPVTGVPVRPRPDPGRPGPSRTR